MAKGFSSLQRESLYKQVERQIGLSIIRGEYEPGEALASEPELSAQFSVSRAVLREALRTLSAKGLVEARPKTGTRVRSRAEWNLLDPEVLAWQYEAGPEQEFLQALCEVRLMLEPMAAHLAAVRATEEEAEAIIRCCRDMEQTLEAPEDYTAVDLRFHMLICLATHNELLLNVMRTLTRAMHASREVTARIPGATRAAMPVHQRVAAAIQQHDEREAEEAMRALISLTLQDIYRAFDDQSPARA
ncbi:FadR/GntR family transcriptional regulator [Ktedonospora formicarum]|uniref:GntR family transcriptional regulator n=1 Tax=Ktedonospora formicarum TaxID=2778364 RepID=A0A8J3HYZ5_9CHLR|nr:FadR/GntR family transcriptional regulator [Ktedonospora formicarum]GHO42514.1 GntR family transcriptional regulator [Ktedonospora formicarum]